MPMDWRGTPNAIDKLISSDIDELERIFPGVKRKTLINRRAEFRKLLMDDVPPSTHGLGDTAKTVQRLTDEEKDVVPRSLYTKAINDRNVAKEKLREYLGAARLSAVSSSRPASRPSRRSDDKDYTSGAGTVHVVIPDTQ